MKRARYSGLDAARAVLMVLGIVYHASKIYIPESQWRVYSTETSELFRYICLLIHDFRMNTFYIIAGFFFVLIIEKYGKYRGIINRSIRMIVPLFVVGIVFNTLVNELSINGHIYNKEYVLHGGWVGHLWFIGNLFLYNIVCLIFVGGFIKKERNTQRLNFYWKVFLVTPLLSFSLSTIIFEENMLFFISFSEFLIYFPYYFLGMYLYKHQEYYFSILTKINITIFLLCYLSVRGGLVLTGIETEILRNLCKSFGNVFLSIAILGIFQLFFNKHNIYFEKFVDASYSIYLLHEPYIVVFYWIIVLSITGIVQQWATLIILVFFLSYFSHTFLIAPSKITLMLFNGKIKK